MKVHKPDIELDEKEFTALVIGSKANPGVARMFGWHVYHTLRSKGSQPGWPDWACVRDRIVMIELKTEKGKVSDAQKEWLAVLTAAGVEAYVVRPRHFDAVTVVLRAKGPIAAWDADAREARGVLLVELDKHIERRTP